jgi:hypothetical protein
MDLAALVTLFMLLGLTFLAATMIAPRGRLACAIASVVCLGVAVVLDIVVLTK